MRTIRLVPRRTRKVIVTKESALPCETNPEAIVVMACHFPVRMAWCFRYCSLAGFFFGVTSVRVTKPQLTLFSGNATGEATRHVSCQTEDKRPNECRRRRKQTRCRHNNTMKTLEVTTNPEAATKLKQQRSIEMANAMKFDVLPQDGSPYPTIWAAPSPPTSGSRGWDEFPIVMECLVEESMEMTDEQPSNTRDADVPVAEKGAVLKENAVEMHIVQPPAALRDSFDWSTFPLVLASEEEQATVQTASSTAASRARVA